MTQTGFTPRHRRTLSLTATLELFPNADLGSRRPAGDNCARPIGNRAAGQRRRAGSVRQKSPTAGQLLELRLLIETQHEAVMGELRLLRQQRRDEGEVPSGILRRLVAIERRLGVVEIPQAPQPTRRRLFDG